MIVRTADKYLERDALTIAAHKAYMELYSPAKKSIKELMQMARHAPLFFVAEEKGEIVGMVRGRISKGKARLVNLFVDENFHNQGIGKLLTQRF